LIPLLLLAYDGDSLVGLAALAASSTQQNASFLGATTADYCDFICHPQRRPELVNQVCAELRKLQVTKLSLANLPADSTTPAALKVEAQKHGFSLFSRQAYLCAQVAFHSPEQRESVKQSAQRRVHRYGKAMGRLASVEVNHLKTWDLVRSALPGLVDAHVARFLAIGRTSNLARLERRVFVFELARLLAAPGWLRLSQLMIGDQPIAWNFGFQFAGSWFWYQPTFDSEFQKY